MKRLLFSFAVFMSAFCYAGGPLFRHTTTQDQQEYDNIYQNFSNIQSQLNTLSSEIPTNFTITGEIRLWPTGTPPTGWLICDGSAVSRTTYSALFSVIGTTFGSGDGSTTFNIPNFKDRASVGVSGTKAIGSTGGAASTTLPNHSHTIASDTQASTGWASDDNAPIGYDPSDTGGHTTRIYQLTTAGSHSNTQVIKNFTNTDGGGASIATLSPYIAINFIIHS